MRFFLLLCLAVVFSLPLPGNCAEQPPQRIVSLGPMNTENVFLLGAGEQLVGNTRYCVRPEAAKGKEKIGSVMQLSMEKILALQPDLVLAIGLTSPRQMKKLRDMGLRVVQFRQPGSFVEICDQFLRLGILLGKEEEAEKIIAQAQQQAAAVKKRLAGLPEQKVFLQIGAMPLFGSVKSSFTHDYIAMSRGVNILADQAMGTTNYEKVIATNPAVILIVVMGAESATAKGEKEKWLNFPVIDAVRNNRVHLLDPDLVCSPSPLTFTRTLAAIAELIHPKSATERKP